MWMREDGEKRGREERREISEDVGSEVVSDEDGKLEG